MKKFLFLSIAICSMLVLNAQTSKKELIAQMFSDVMVLSDASIDDQLPIVSINEIAMVKADKAAEVTKDNLSDLLAEAKNYKTVYMTVGKHTIVKITDLNDCQASGAWGTCMPKGEGYVQKGELQAREGYINFIIGIPDSQKRMMFMFKVKP